MKGLTTCIYKSKNYDCSTNHFFGQKDFTLIDLKQDGTSKAENDSAGLLVRRICMNQKLPIIIPCRFTDDGVMEVLTGTMFGGSFAYDSDSRFHANCPIPIHDRVEGSKHWVNAAQWLMNPHNRQYSDASLKVRGDIFA